MLSWLRKLSAWPVVVPSGAFQLRPMRSYDLLTVSHWFTDLEVLRYAFGSQAEEEALRDMALRYQAEMDAQRQYIITLETVDQKAFGFVRYTIHHDLYARSGNRKAARIGILIGEKRHWGKGWGTEAMVAFVDYLFRQKSVERIELDTAQFNTRAQRCFEKCGFIIAPPPENYLAYATDPTPKIWMEITKSRWESRR